MRKKQRLASDLLNEFDFSMILQKCLQGPKGELGSKGDKGDTGISGAPGAKGQKGEKGTQGNTGNPGRSNQPDGSSGRPSRITVFPAILTVNENQTARFHCASAGQCD